MVAQLKEQLRDASLVRAEPWQQIAQSSNMVLLRGQLRTSGRTSKKHASFGASLDDGSSETQEALQQQQQASARDPKYNVKARMMRPGRACSCTVPRHPIPDLKLRRLRSCCTAGPA